MIQVYVVYRSINEFSMILSGDIRMLNKTVNQKSFFFHIFCWAEGGEWSDSSRFALCTIICHSTFPLGLMLMSGAAYFIRNWRILQLVLFCPLILVLGIFYWSVATPVTLNIITNIV